MFIVDNYFVAVILCVVTMLCWGSWGNTQKLAAKSWRYELFYWDYVIGILIFSLLAGFTLGSFGDSGRSFVPDLMQADKSNIISAIIGGVIFNAANILLSASIALAGMAVAFPLGVGIALVLGVFVNYFSAPKGDPFMLFLGVALVVIAVILNGIAAGKMKTNSEENQSRKKGVLLALVAGVLMAFFYRFVAAAMDLNNFEAPAVGMLTPYSAFFVFSIGIFLSNFIFNSIVMRKPFEGNPVSYKEYFKGTPKLHLVGVLGGCIWALGTLLSYIAAGKAGAAISYALGQGAPMIAAVWGVFIWKEFKGSSKIVNRLLIAMFILFIAGLSFIVVAGNSDKSATDNAIPISVIFETDMANDVDDAMALDLLYKYMDEGKVNVLAIMSNNSSPFSTRFTDVMNVWYGYPEIPIGEIVNGKDTIDDSVNYAKIMCELKDENGQPYFKESVTDGFEEATKLYRKILSSQPDKSVIIASVGFSTNLAKLLQTPSDEYSFLTGKELVEQKVKLLSVMAGSFGENAIQEFNVRTDIEGAKMVFEEWPTNIVVTPFEAGIAVEYPYHSIENDFSWSEAKHPMIESYKVYTEMPHNRPTWDLISVLYAIEPSSEFFSESEKGRVAIDEKGYSSFVGDKKGKHAFLTINPTQAEKVKAHFVKILSRKPMNK